MQEKNITYPTDDKQYKKNWYWYTMYAVKIEHNFHIIAKVLAEAISLNSSRLLRLANADCFVPRNEISQWRLIFKLKMGSIHFKSVPNIL